jgi:hypothetical protein
VIISDEHCVQNSSKKLLAGTETVGSMITMPWDWSRKCGAAHITGRFHGCRPVFTEFITDRQYAKERLDYILLRPVRLYFNNELREQWLRDMVTEGKDKHLLNDEDAGVILSQIKEPYIQKY